MAADRTGDLFAAAAEDRLARQAPLAARLRPHTLDEVVGQDQLLGPGRPLRALVEADRLSLGDPLGAAGHRQDHARPAHRRRTVQGVRAALRGERRRSRTSARWSARPSSAWASGARARSCSSTRSTGSTRPSRTRCCPSVETGLLVLVGATTENPYFEVNPPLLQPLDAVPPGAARTRRAGATLAERGLEAEGADGRRRGRSPTWSTGPAATVGTLLTSLEVALALAAGRVERGPARPHVTLVDAEAALGTVAAALRPRRPLRRDLGLHQDASGAPTPTPRCTGWPGCWRRGRTPASSPAGW